MKPIFSGWILVTLLALCSCGIEGQLAFLHDPPIPERLPGTYVLDPRKYSYSALTADGYADLSAALLLKSDGTFTATRIPDCCIYIQRGNFGGYFDGEGTWAVEKKSAVFDVRLRFSNMRRQGSTTQKQPQALETAAFTLTRGSPSYGLAAPLFDGGEFIYAYFEKKK